MQLDDFNFALPDGLIATRPASPRGSARLLVADAAGHHDERVADLPAWLCPGDRLVVNNTRVIPARLGGMRQRPGASGARIDITLLNPMPDGTWRALAKPLRKLAVGDVVTFAAGFHATVAAREPATAILAFNLTGPAFDAALDQTGMMPLPPYIAALRPADAQDRTDYQPLFARHAGAVAAPTASLHFDADLMTALSKRGVTITEVTLHVGAGTFLPVKVQDVATHRMHAEWGEVTAGAAADIAATKAAGGRVIAVGTTALRLIETAAAGGQIGPWRGDTDIFIYPGYQFRVADGLITNFHLPKSTLLMLVSALMGRQRMLELYDHAIATGYRFFSYGDASLLLPHGADRG